MLKYPFLLLSVRHLKRLSLIHIFKKSDTAVIVDPVMGDHGTAYRTCTPELCRGMRVLAENADVITPNLTEAALLLDHPYEEIQRTDAYEVVRRLSLGGRRSVAVSYTHLDVYKRQLQHQDQYFLLKSFDR